MGIHAAEVGGVDVAAAHVDAFAEPGFLQEQRQQRGDRQEDQERHRYAQHALGADKPHDLRHAAQGGAARQVDADAVDRGHGGQRHQNRVRADVGHQRTGRRADKPGQQHRRRQRQRQPQRLQAQPGVRRQVADEQPGHQQAGQVGAGDNAQVQAAAEDRNEHRQRQQAQLWQLEGHAGESGAAEEAPRHQQAEGEHHRQQQGQQTDGGPVRTKFQVVAHQALLRRNRRRFLCVSCSE
ncbi:Uncharacterised protein [Acinetobacter baumannii]|nr:Uncharacterised protein [Acinetobacter baumannii]